MGAEPLLWKEFHGGNGSKSFSKGDVCFSPASRSHTVYKDEYRAFLSLNDQSKREFSDSKTRLEAFNALQRFADSKEKTYHSDAKVLIAVCQCLAQKQDRGRTHCWRDRGHLCPRTGASYSQWWNLPTSAGMTQSSFRAILHLKPGADDSDLHNPKANTLTQNIRDRQCQKLGSPAHGIDRVPELQLATTHSTLPSRRPKATTQKMAEIYLKNLYDLKFYSAEVLKTNLGQAPRALIDDALQKGEPIINSATKDRASSGRFGRMVGSGYRYSRYFSRYL